MSEYRSNIDLPGVVQRICGADRVAVTTHAKPDGDAFGSVVAMSLVLRQMGKEVSAWFIPPLPVALAALDGSTAVQNYNPSVGLGEPDLVVILDVGAWAQLSPMGPELSRVLDRTLIIDHHVAGDIATPWRYVDRQAAACCEIVAQILDQFQADGLVQGDLWTPTVCEALFVGVASDTGWFRFSNTRPQTHELAARLLRRGVDQSQLYQKIEQRSRPEKLALQIRALDSLQLYAGGQVAVMVLRADDFLESGAILEETERFVDMPQSVESVRVVALVTETPPHHSGHSSSGSAGDGQEDPAAPPTVRLSFRSKSGANAVDVAKLASQFGGGGHARAAGAKVKAPLDQVIQRVCQATTAAVAVASQETT